MAFVLYIFFLSSTTPGKAAKRRMKTYLGQKGYILNPNRWFEWPYNQEHIAKQGRRLSSETKSTFGVTHKSRDMTYFLNKRKQQVAHLT